MRDGQSFDGIIVVSENRGFLIREDIDGDKPVIQCQRGIRAIEDDILELIPRSLDGDIRKDHRQGLIQCLLIWVLSREVTLESQAIHRQDPRLRRSRPGDGS